MTAAVVVAIASAAITLTSLTYTIWDKRRSLSKSLAWYLVSNTSLMPDHKDKKWTADLQVNWKGASLQHPRLVLIRIVNTGRVELKKDDISVPARVSVDGKIVSAEIRYEQAGGAASIGCDPATAKETSIEAPQMVLNPADALAFSLLVDGEEVKPEAAMAAAGFKFAREARDPFTVDEAKYDVPIAIVAMGFLIGLGFAFRVLVTWW
jgi:hypothetical protein